MAKPDHEALDSSQQVSAEIEITPAMIEAGVQALGDFNLTEPWSRIIEGVYLAMELERRIRLAPPL